MKNLNRIFSNKAALVAVCALLLCAGMATSVKVTGASASGFIASTVSFFNGNGPVPCPVGNLCITQQSITAVLGGNSLGMTDIASGQLHIGSYVMAKGISKKVVRKAKAHGKCMQVGAGTRIKGYWNSYRGANGAIVWFWDTRRATACFINGVWRKVGPKNCGNLLRFNATPPHATVVTGKVIVVRNAAKVFINAQAYAAGSLHDTCGELSGHASTSLRMSLAEFASVKGAAVTRLNAKVAYKLQATIQGYLHCEKPTTVVITTTTPPVTTTTTHTVTSTTQTTTTQTTTTQTTTTPVQHSCTLAVALASKSDAYTATASVGADSTPSSVTFNWGDGAQTTGPAGASHTYPVPTGSSTAGDGVTYYISSTATVGGQTVTCRDSQGRTSVPFFVPAPVVTTTNGTTTTVTNPGPPPMP